MRFYEVVIALSPEVSEADQKAFFAQIKDLIKKFSGNIHHIDLLGSRALANPKKHKNIKRALYFHLSYKAKPPVVTEVERLFRMNEFVLFFHHEKLDSRISLDKHQEKFEQILMESKEREESRQARLQVKRKKFQNGASQSKEGPAS